MPKPNLPSAAYLYTLSLDEPGIAWEYLRRNDGYRADWDRRARADAPEPWGLRFP